MRYIPIALAAVGLLFAALTYPASALTGDDIEALAQIVETAEDDKAAITKYAEDKGETVTVYEGEDAQAFNLQMIVRYGSAAPAGTAYFVVAQEDASDQTQMLMVFDKDGKFLGKTWLRVDTVESIVQTFKQGS